MVTLSPMARALPGASSVDFAVLIPSLMGSELHFFRTDTLPLVD